jgi:hypothetical protein
MVVTSRHKKLAEELGTMEESGQTIKGAMMASGYSEPMASRGWTGVPKSVFALLAKRGTKLTRLGAELSLDDCKHLVLGRLAENCVKGKDGGVMSAKVLGSRRELNLWTPDSQVGVIVLNQSQAQVEKMLEPPAELAPEEK